MKRILATILIFIVTLSSSVLVLAHGNEKHSKKAATTEHKITPVAPDTTVLSDTVIQQITPEAQEGHRQDPSTAHATPSDFPNTHPLIVHFPIVLLLVAAAVALCNILFLRKELDWIVTIATLIGFSTAYYATELAHPHTTGLSEHAQLILDQHDLFADWTIYMGGIGLVFQGLNQFLFKGKRWSVLVAAFILTGTAYAVAMAGHYGAQLVHIEGVGPQGKYLEEDHH